MIVLLIIHYPFDIISIFLTKQHIIGLNIDIEEIENADIFITYSFAIYTHFYQYRLQVVLNFI